MIHALKLLINENKSECCGVVSGVCHCRIGSVYYYFVHSLNWFRLHSFVAHFIYFIIMSIVAVQLLCKNVESRQIVTNNYNGEKNSNKRTRNSQPTRFTLLFYTIGERHKTIENVTKKC